jgi:hypothetical protein
MTEAEQEKPFGILLATTFFILVGTYFFATASYITSNSNYLMVQLLILTFIGIFYILLGWGVLLLKKWAYYLVIISTVCSLFFMFFTVGLFPFYASSLLFYINLFCHIGIIIYIVPRSNLFGFISTYPNPVGSIRICPDCKKNIPFDALICPYCGKKFKSYL